jgi:hypothetical protein
LDFIIVELSCFVFPFGFVTILISVIHKFFVVVVSLGHDLHLVQKQTGGKKVLVTSTVILCVFICPFLHSLTLKELTKQVVACGRLCNLIVFTQNFPISFAGE